jgi:3',5'-cyclic AMP phosphodiesterase CpdA
MTSLTRRELVRGAGALAGAGGAALVLSGCGGSGAPVAARSGSTLESTWGDPVGDGQLVVQAGEPFVQRLELGERRRVVRTLATLAHVTDAHVLDASSPARVTFLNRLGPPFQSTFRPHETLTAQVLAGALASVRELAPDLVIQGGDLIDNDQANELSVGLSVLSGGVARPGSGPDGYYGVQVASDPDPFYYRPDVDAPVHPGLLRAAVRAFACRGVGVPWCPVMGDHDALVAGELVPTALTASLAVGGRALWELPAGLSLPRGLALRGGGSPDGPPVPAEVDRFLVEALQGPTVSVPADTRRRELSAGEVVGRLRSAASARMSFAGDGRLDYVVDVGERVRVIVLDLARRGGGSGGLVVPGQVGFVASAVASAGVRAVLVVSHQPLGDSVGGGDVLALLDRSPAVIATLAGHTHRNRIVPRRSQFGGYWQIETASLIDYPQHARALTVVETEGGGVAIRTWMLDHVFPGPLGSISRELAYLDALGGRPAGFAGGRGDRNAVLYGLK